jgi:hypothetical protein
LSLPEASGTHIAKTSIEDLAAKQLSEKTNIVNPMTQQKFN